MDDKEFIIRALSIHAALTRPLSYDSTGCDFENDAEVYYKKIATYLNRPVYRQRPRHRLWLVSTNSKSISSGEES
jgi:hypothetical protein